MLQKVVKSDYVNSEPICIYHCEDHQGKIDQHHPCSEYPLVVIPLCEAHHSLLSLGRKVRYPFEMTINKTLDEMRWELKELELKVVRDSGLSEKDIDKK
jgi:hypothetical protein